MFALLASSSDDTMVSSAARVALAALLLLSTPVHGATRAPKLSEAALSQIIKDAIREALTSFGDSDEGDAKKEEEEEEEEEEEQDVAKVEDIRRRQLASVPDLADYSGVRVRNDKAVIAMGTDADVMLMRSGPEHLDILASVNISGELRVNSSLCGCFTEEAIRAIVEDVIGSRTTSSTASTTDGSGSCPATCGGYTCDQL